MNQKQPFTVGLFQMQVSLPDKHGNTTWVAPGGLHINDYQKARRIAIIINRRVRRG